MRYILEWYVNNSNDKVGYTVYTSTELFELVKPYYKEPFPLTLIKLGKDLKEFSFIAKRRIGKGNQYSVNWDHDYTQLELNEIIEHAYDHDDCE